MISQWGGVFESADEPSTRIVGAHRVADETLRLREYSPGVNPEQFAAHERFFVDDVGAWTRSRFGMNLPAERTAVFGVSAGGDLALAIGLRHPDLYGAIFSASPGAGYRPPNVLPSPLPRTYLVAGQRPPSALVGKWKSNAVVDNYANSVVHVRWNRFSSTTRPSGRLHRERFRVIERSKDGPRIQLCAPAT